MSKVAIQNLINNGIKRKIIKLDFIPLK